MIVIRNVFQLNMPDPISGNGARAFGRRESAAFFRVLHRIVSVLQRTGVGLLAGTDNPQASAFAAPGSRRRTHTGRGASHSDGEPRALFRIGGLARNRWPIWSCSMPILSRIRSVSRLNGRYFDRAARDKLLAEAKANAAR